MEKTFHIAPRGVKQFNFKGHIDLVLEKNEELGALYIGDAHAARDKKCMSHYNITAVLSCAQFTGVKFLENIM